LPAASLAFIAISEPISANEKEYKKCRSRCGDLLDIEPKKPRKLKSVDKTEKRIQFDINNDQKIE